MCMCMYMLEIYLFNVNLMLQFATINYDLCNDIMLIFICVKLL